MGLAAQTEQLEQQLRAAKRAESIWDQLPGLSSRREPKKGAQIQKYKSTKAHKYKKLRKFKCRYVCGRYLLV